MAFIKFYLLLVISLVPWVAESITLAVFGILALTGIIYVVPATNEHATLAPLP